MAAVIAVGMLTAGAAAKAQASGGVLQLVTRDEDHGVAVPARLELADQRDRQPRLRKSIACGVGVALDREIELPLGRGHYRFRVVRGPEYRIVSGTFEMLDGGADERVVRLARMVDMKAEGYLAGDMAWYGPDEALPLQMAAEDLHVAVRVAAGASQDGRPPRTARRDDSVATDDPLLGPIWIDQSATAVDDVLLYRPAGAEPQPVGDEPATSQLLELPAERDEKVAIVNPFSWQMPVLLASDRVDGVFVLGPWQVESSPRPRIAAGRPAPEVGFTGNLGPGQYAEAIYWKLLEAGLQIAPLAGSGDQAEAAVGYNRIYAIGAMPAGGDARDPEPVGSQREFYEAAWAGRSIVTNGPLLRPTLGGFAPGHVFDVPAGQTLQLGLELEVAIREPVEYLDIIKNGRVIHSERLEKLGEGTRPLPELTFDDSGWVIVRLVTEHQDHYRMAMSAPWYVVVDQTPRVSRSAVEYFAAWLTDCEETLKKLPRAELTPHIRPVQVARKFWQQRLERANTD